MRKLESTNIRCTRVIKLPPSNVKQTSTPSEQEASVPSSPPSSADSVTNSTDKAKPFISENIYSERQSSDISPESSTSVPSPAGTTEPVKENAKTVEPLADTVKPFAAASPPLAASTHPL